MDVQFYLDQFQKTVDGFDKKHFAKKQLEVAVGVYKENSVFIKLYKQAWINPEQDPLTAESRIFFSVWVTDASMQDKKIWYNIHAFKLRKLKGYSIKSRKFAELFRADFKNFRHKWQNVSVNFGPLTLMEGWTKINGADLQERITELAFNFFETADLIDSTLIKFKR